MSVDTGKLKIIDPGPATMVQDMGRHAARRQGVPVAGTLCPDWLQLANLLIGNPPDAAGLEFRLMGPRFTVEGAETTLAVAGPAELSLDGAEGSQTVPAWTAVRAQPGDRIAVGRITAGTTALLVVSGGIATDPFLGSRSTYARAHLGGFEGRALRPGDILPCGAPATTLLHQLSPAPSEDVQAPIRVVLGPQDDHFDAASITAFLDGVYTVTNSVDRMGMRLEGPGLNHRSPEMREIVSDAIVPGAVQVPGNGQPIVLLADGQTVGGYPKIATVISADLPRLARRAPTERIRFAAVSPARAEALARAAQEDLAAYLAKAVPVTTAGGVDLRQLYETNLISGVITGWTR
ncbi:biotin-dependent carboxyltransferase family protein [Tropicimonas sp. S265A]|uniref:5-oxoprolinase subunit C family protein n=1 Tax=Tropicimonas sp. S265A TaxID=3415134 RepID=UPI003C7A2616